MDYLDKTKQYKESFLQDLADIIAIPSLRNDEQRCANMPFGKACREVLDIMLEKAKKDGFKVKDYDGYAGVIEYGEGEESIGILGHLDIVPIGDGWSKDPLGCEIHDGYLFGRGVLDDKGPTMCAYYALKMIKDLQIKLNKKVILILGCDEESGMQCMDYYAKHGEIPTIGFTPDADFPVIYGEKGILTLHLKGNEKTKIKKMRAGERHNIVIGKASACISKMDVHEKQMFNYYLKTHQLQGEIMEQGEDSILIVEGKYMHAAMCYDGINAALHLLNFVGETYNDVICKQLYMVLKNWRGSGLGIDIEGSYMGFLTMNTGIVNIENDIIDVVLDIRYPNDTTQEKLIQKIGDTLQSKHISLNIENVDNSNPLFVNPESKLVKTLSESYRRYSGDHFTPAQTIGGGTYARKFENFVAFGPEFPHKEKTSFFVGGPHEKDEGIKIEDLLKAIAIYADAIENLGK